MPPRRDRSQVDFSRTGIARYIQLASLFRLRIESGLWVSGQQIPTVDDLSAECGVARATIRQALGILEDEHLIERHRAKGTFVLERPRDQIWCEVATDWSGLLMSRRDAVDQRSSPTSGRASAIAEIRSASSRPPIAGCADGIRGWARRSC
jgi:GntR family transcriptional regulator